MATPSSSLRPDVGTDAFDAILLVTKLRFVTQLSSKLCFIIARCNLRSGLRYRFFKPEAFRTLDTICVKEGS